MTETSLKARLLEPRRHARQCSDHAPAEALAARLIMPLAGASLLLFLASALIPSSASDVSSWTGQSPQLENRAAVIVNGHHAQPRRADAPASVTDEVQQLSRHLMERTASSAAQTNAAPSGLVHSGYARWAAALREPRSRCLSPCSKLGRAGCPCRPRGRSRRKAGTP